MAGNGRICNWFLMVSIVYLTLSPSSNKHIWPLFPHLVNYDLKAQEYLGKPICTEDGPNHPDLGYSSMPMRGNSTSGSHIDILVDYTTEMEDFAILTFVYLTNDEGTILDIHSKVIDSFDMNLVLFYNTTSLYLRITDHLELSDVIVMSPTSISKNQWTAVGVIFIDSSFSFLVNMSITSPTLFNDGMTLVLQGTLRIGSGFASESIDAEGYISCLTMYDSDIEISKVQSALGYCHRSGWPTAFTHTLGTGSRQCSNSSGHYTHVAVNQTPDSTMNQILNVTTRSRLECATMCSKNDTCLSFTFNTESRLCGTFSSNEFYDLKVDQGTNYYIGSHLLECCL
ncbi:hypothetical protein ACF0H5_024547 [Mactra antiquata]